MQETLGAGSVRGARALIIVLGMFALQGCAAAVLSVAGIAGGAGFEHVINGTVSHTYSAPIAGTRLAALNTLKRMGMRVKADTRSADGWSLVASAAERTINIDLEALTVKSVQMRVDVHRNDFILLKDPSTARQIIEQTEVQLKRVSRKQSEIATVQMMLGELGYDTKVPDGIMGPKTKRAIVKFQRRNQIRVDGRLSPQLMAKVQRKRDAVKARKKKYDPFSAQKFRVTPPKVEESHTGD
jgi:hypothetical protein